MRALALLVLLPAAAIAQTPDDASRAFKPKNCVGAPVTPVRSGKARFQRLGELPPASEYLAVARSIARCSAPLIVRTGIGGDPVAPRR